LNSPTPAMVSWGLREKKRGPGLLSLTTFEKKKKKVRKNARPQKNSQRLNNDGFGGRVRSNYKAFRWWGGGG